MVNNVEEGTIKFVSDFTTVIMTNRTRWQAEMHEVEIQKIHSWAKTAMFCSRYLWRLLLAMDISI